MSSKQIAIILISLVLSPMLSVMSTPFLVFFRKVFYVPFARKKYLKEAIEKGNIVQAKLVRSRDVTEDYNGYGLVSSNEVIGLYEYSYNGKKYKYRASATSILPDELTLYFIKNPKKACLSDEIGFRESNWIKTYLYSVITLWILGIIVGVFYA